MLRYHYISLYAISTAWLLLTVRNHQKWSETFLERCESSSVYFKRFQKCHLLCNQISLLKLRIRPYVVKYAMPWILAIFHNSYGNSYLDGNQFLKCKEILSVKYALDKPFYGVFNSVNKILSLKQNELPSLSSHEYILAIERCRVCRKYFGWLRWLFMKVRYALVCVIDMENFDRLKWNYWACANNWYVHCEK